MSENVNEQISKTRMMICKKAERKGVHKVMSELLEKILNRENNEQSL